MRENKVRYIELLSNPVGCGVPSHFSDLLFVQHERVFGRCPCCETAKGRNRELRLDCRVDALRQYQAGINLKIAARLKTNSFLPIYGHARGPWLRPESTADGPNCSGEVGSYRR